jgi:hypothetical protein
MHLLTAEVESLLHTPAYERGQIFWPRFFVRRVWLALEKGQAEKMLVGGFFWGMVAVRFGLRDTAIGPLRPGRRVSGPTLDLFGGVDFSSPPNFFQSEGGGSDFVFGDGDG